MEVVCRKIFAKINHFAHSIHVKSKLSEKQICEVRGKDESLKPSQNRTPYVLEDTRIKVKLLLPSV